MIGRLQQAYRDVMVEFPWQRGDVVLLDNILALHARNAFTGPRRILTAMAIAQKSADLALD
ncbi:Taurine catabolism dioxygenase TauD, TfdA family [compost metagenome]